MKWVLLQNWLEGHSEKKKPLLRSKIISRVQFTHLLFYEDMQYEKKMFWW